jgi:hypothetical protein
MKQHCQIFEVDVSQLTADQLKERCSGCLEHTGGVYCSHLTTQPEPDRATIYDTPILIPSKSRAGKSKLLTTLNNLHYNAYIFVEPQELHTYQFTYPNLMIIDIMQTNQGITFVRNLIRRFAEEYEMPSYWMMDDDVQDFYFRKGQRMVRADMIPVLHAAETVFVEQGAWLAALEYQQLAWSATRPFIVDSFAEVCGWNNTKLTHGLRYRPEVEGKEDRDFAMQIIKQGGKTIRSTLHAFAAPKNGSNAGGLKEIFYDIQDREEACVDALVKLWPGVVTKIRKEDGRVDARINWKDIKSGQQSIQEMFGI